MLGLNNYGKSSVVRQLSTLRLGLTEVVYSGDSFIPDIFKEVLVLFLFLVKKNRPGLFLQHLHICH